MHEIRNDIELRDIEGMTLVVSHNRVAEGRTYTEAEYTSDRLPVEFLTLFDGGTVDVCDLTTEEQQWIEAEGGRIEFSETAQ